jgi:hypothetical protein
VHKEQAQKACSTLSIKTILSSRVDVMAMEFHSQCEELNPSLSRVGWFIFLPQPKFSQRSFFLHKAAAI